MPSAVSNVSLCNRALLQIGSKVQISSLTEGSTQSDACNTLFTPTFEQLARSAWWNCLQKQGTLSLLKAAASTPENPSGNPPFPPSPWLYEYAYPSDCLKARAIVPSYPSAGTGVSVYALNNAAPIWLRGMGQIPFKVAYDTDSVGNPLTVILTNQSQAQLMYTTDQPNPVIWDSQFQAAFVAALGAFLVPPLTMNIPQLQLQIGAAERAIADARASDGNEGSNTQDHMPDWIRARAGGSGGWYEGAWCGVGYDNMLWPSIG